SSWQVREKAIDALGKLKDDRGSATAISSLTDSVGQVRKAAAVALGRLGSNESIPELTSALGDDFYGARMSAMEALVKLDTAEVILTLSDSMSSANEMIGNLACRALGEIGTDEARDVLLIQVERGSLQRRAQAALAIVNSDPEDRCGFHQQIITAETDRLVRIQIESAIKSAENGN
ncbi:MAG: HEAT repeat domain-containing protein, partial [bacterium]|nr:HEAT repeat domain-containing protein [bacterium]